MQFCTVTLQFHTVTIIAATGGERVRMLAQDIRHVHYIYAIIQRSELKQSDSASSSTCEMEMHMRSTGFLVAMLVRRLSTSMLRCPCQCCCVMKNKYGRNSATLTCAAHGRQRTSKQCVLENDKRIAHANARMTARMQKRVVRMLNSQWGGMWAVAGMLQLLGTL